MRQGVCLGHMNLTGKWVCGDKQWRVHKDLWFCTLEMNYDCVPVFPVVEQQSCTWYVQTVAPFSSSEKNRKCFCACFIQLFLKIRRCAASACNDDKCELNWSEGEVHCIYTRRQYFSYPMRSCDSLSTNQRNRYRIVYNTELAKRRLFGLFPYIFNF